MPIVSGNLKFFASERMIDNLSTLAGVGGGGYMSDSEIIDGTTNNVFPDVMPGDRVAGVMQLRQVYPIVLSAGNDSLSNAESGILARPTDDNVEVVAFTAPGTLSVAAAGSLGTKWSTNFGSEYLGWGHGTANTMAVNPSGATLPSVGELVRIATWATTPSAGYIDRGLRVVTAVSGYNVTVDGDILYGGTNDHYIWRLSNPGIGTRVSAVSHMTAGASAADTTITLDKLWAAVQLPGASTLGVSGEPTARAGKLPLYLIGDKLLLENGSTREVAVISAVNYLTGVVTLTAGLTNAFASGTKVTRPVSLGILQSVANNVFAQQTWTRAWSNSPAGSGISARYSGAIPMTNDGAVTDRWAVVFTSASNFNLLSERYGQIASGNIGSDFMPLNPTTSQPYFTLLSSGWGAGWLPGNVVRFNTIAASAPMWLSRLTLPSDPTGTDQATLFLRGDVDA